MNKIETLIANIEQYFHTRKDSASVNEADVQLGNCLTYLRQQGQGEPVAKVVCNNVPDHLFGLGPNLTIVSLPPHTTLDIGRRLCLCEQGTPDKTQQNIESLEAVIASDLAAQADAHLKQPIFTSPPAPQGRELLENFWNDMSEAANPHAFADRKDYEAVWTVVTEYRDAVIAADRQIRPAEDKQMRGRDFWVAAQVKEPK